MSQEMYSSASSDDQSSINSVVHVIPHSERSDEEDSDFSVGRSLEGCSDVDGSEIENEISQNSGVLSEELDNENLEHGDTTTDSEQDSLLSGDRRIRNDSVTSSSSEETQVWVPLRASPKVTGLRGTNQLHHSPAMRQSIVSQNSATGRIETALTMEEMTGFNGDSGISNESPETQSSGEMTHLQGIHHHSSSHYVGGHYGGTHYSNHQHHYSSHHQQQHSRPSSHLQHIPLSTIPSPPHTPSLSHQGMCTGSGSGGTVDALRAGPDALFVSQSEMDAHFRHSLFNLLSALYALLLIIIGVVLPVSETIADPLNQGSFESFYLYLYLVSIIFLVYVSVCLMSQKRVGQLCHKASMGSNLNTPEDSLIKGTSFSRRRGLWATMDGQQSFRGSFYLRLGAVGFGIGAMIQEGLMFGEIFEYEPVSSCINYVSIIKPAVHLIFIFIQLYFIFLNSKITINKYKVLARFGLMHMIATNLCIWIRTVVREIVRDVRLSSAPLNVTVPPSSPSHQSASSTTHPTPSLLSYPLAPQSLLVQNLSKDTGGASEAGVSSLLYSSFNSTGNVSFIMGSGSSSSSTVSPPVECLRQEILRHVVDRVSPYLYPCTIHYCIIAAGMLYLMWWNTSASPCSRPNTQQDGSGTNDGRGTVSSKKSLSSMNVVVDCSSATRGLFFGIFTLVSTIISLIVFFVLIERPRYISVSVIVIHTAELTLYCLASTAVLLAAYKMRDMRFDHRPRGLGAGCVNSVGGGIVGGGASLDDVMLLISLLGLYLYWTFSAVAGRYHVPDVEEDSSNAGSLLTASSALVIAQGTAQAVFIIHGLRRSAQKSYHVRTKPGREYVTFLLVCNVAAWGVAIMEVPRTRANPVAVDFYGTLTWAIVTHITSPLIVFYRFYSTVCLAKIWKNAYKQKIN